MKKEKLLPVEQAAQIQRVEATSTGCGRAAISVSRPLVEKIGCRARVESDSELTACSLWHPGLSRPALWHPGLRNKNLLGM
jgi:hypothetical protein